MIGRETKTVGMMFLAAAACAPVANPEPKSAAMGIEKSAGKSAGQAKSASHAKVPPSGTVKTSPFPKVDRRTLGNGLRVGVVPLHQLPVVQLRLLVHAGVGYAGIPAVPGLTAKILKDGGTKSMTSNALLERVETLGANLSVSTGLDSTVFALEITKDHLNEALAILAELVREPRFDESEFKKLKAREVDAAHDRARSSGNWMAMRVLMTELFGSKSAYGTVGALASEIERVSLNDVKAFHKGFYVPKNVELIVAGDVTSSNLMTLANDALGKWSGGEPPKMPLLVVPTLPESTVIVANRPKSSQSDVYVVGLAPARDTVDWPAVRVTNQVLGGGPASLLFLDVREQRSLAYTANSFIVELARGAQPILAYAGTQTPKTSLAVQGILDIFTKLRNSPIDAEESDSARRFLADVFALRMETAGAIANMVVEQATFGLPDGYWDSYRQALRTVDGPSASAVARRLFSTPRPLVVVAGDADVIAPGLAQFGNVRVVDPEREFQTIRVIPVGTAISEAAPKKAMPAAKSTKEAR